MKMKRMTMNKIDCYSKREEGTNRIRQLYF